MALKRALFTSTFLSGMVISTAAALAGPPAPLVVDDGTPYVVTGTEAYTSVWVGENNPSQSLSVSSGGDLTSDSVALGVNPDSTGNTVTVTGNGSTWTNTDSILIGAKSTDNKFYIQNESSVGSGSTWLGFEAGSNQNTLQIDNATLTNSTNFVVGGSGTGNTVTIQNGGTETNLYGFVGYETSSTGNTVTVTGTGSKWTNTDTLYFGNKGGQNALNVQDEGQVSVGFDMVIGALGGSDGNEVFVDGDGARLDITKRLYVGRNGDNNSVTVSNGADMTSLDARVGGSTNSTVYTKGNSVTITGAGSTWTMSGTLRIGDGLGNGSDNNVVNISDGGTLTMTGSNKTTYIGFAATDHNNALKVTGAGSSYTTNGDILVGANFFQAGNSLLEVTDGGSVSTTGGIGIGGTSKMSVGAGSSVSAATLGMQSGSTLTVGLSDTAPASISVTGTATLAGTLQADIGAGGLLSNRYDVLTYGTRSGAFDELALIGYNANYTGLIGYDADSAYVQFIADLGAGEKLNKNQNNVATALDDYFNGGGVLTTAIAGLYGLTGSELKEALTEASGEVGATGGVNAIERATTSFLNLMLGGGGQSAAPGSAHRMASVSSMNTGVVPTADVPPEQGGWSMWGGVYGGTANLPGSSSDGSHDTDTTVGGIAAGWDYDIAPDTRIGLALAGGRTSWELDDSLGNGDSTFLQLGGYGTQHFGASYLSLGAAYAWHSMSTDRRVNIDGSEKLDADFDASNLSGRIEAGHRFAAGSQLGLTPYAAFQAQAIWMPGYREHGAAADDSFAVDYQSNEATALRSEVGVGIDTALGLDPSAASVFGRVAWAHDWNSDANVQASFASLDMGTFTVYGAEAPENIALVTAGAEFGLSEATRLAATFDGEFGNDYQSYAGSVSLRYSW